MVTWEVWRAWGTVTQIPARYQGQMGYSGGAPDTSQSSTLQGAPMCCPGPCPPGTVSPRLHLQAAPSWGTSLRIRHPSLCWYLQAFYL